MTDIRVDSQAVDEAERHLSQLARDFERAARLAEISLDRAPLAQGAADTFTDEWRGRCEADLTGIETLALSLSLIGRAFEATDTKFAEQLRMIQTLNEPEATS